MAGHLYAPVAHPVEHITFNDGVEGSSPSWRTIDAFLVRILREENRQRYTLFYCLLTKVRILPLPVAGRGGTGVNCTLRESSGLVSVVFICIHSITG